MEIIKQRAAKFKRQPLEVGGIILQERDLNIVKLVYDYRFLNSEQIKALINGSERGILRRLQKLFHHGFLDRPLSQIVYPLTGTPKMVYALGDKGADLLATVSALDRGKIKWREKNKEVKDRHIQHTLMISNFRVCLKKSLDMIPDANLLFWEKENVKKLKDYVYIRDLERGKIRLPIIPDGFLGIQDKRGKMYFFLEADQSTMTNARFFKKMKAYWNWWRQGGHTRRFGIKAFRVLTIAKTEKRGENLREITKKADDQQTGSFMFWFTSEENYHLDRPESILGPIWKTPKESNLYSILDYN